MTGTTGCSRNVVPRNENVSPVCVRAGYALPGSPERECPAQSNDDRMALSIPSPLLLLLSFLRPPACLPAWLSPNPSRLARRIESRARGTEERGIGGEAKRQEGTERGDRIAVPTTRTASNDNIVRSRSSAAATDAARARAQRITSTTIDNALTWSTATERASAHRVAHTFAR